VSAAVSFQPLLLPHYRSSLYDTSIMLFLKGNDRMPLPAAADDLPD
jgi:hypothetical protein